MAFKRKKGDKKGEQEMSFLEHLETLRWHIIRAVLAIAIMTILAFIFKKIIFDYIILAPQTPDFFTNRILRQLGDLLGTDVLDINSKPLQLINIQMSGQLTTHIAVSMVSGVILAFPFVIWEFWRFFKPALHSNEKHYARGAVMATSLLFFTGVLFGYYMIVPLSIHFLGSYQISEQVVNQIYVRSYIGTLTSIVLASGLIFELPIFAFFLTKIGIVTPSFLRQYRRYAIVIIFVLAAIITPPDVFSQILVAIPLLGLYEISILVSIAVMRKKAKDHDDFMHQTDAPQTENSTL
jgi:sec-independent protein translocase protein TatC